jgi:hypothetical protein
MFRRLKTAIATAEITETRLDAEAARDRHARALAIGALLGR